MKFTKTSLKKFIKQNKDNLFIKQESRFDGMDDCVNSCRDAEFIKVYSNLIDFTKDRTYGIDGLWLVGSSRDYFEVINENEIRIYNSCGSCYLKKVV